MPKHKNNKVIVHGFVKNWCFEVGNGIEPVYVPSICPETTWQKLESQRVYLSLKSMNLYMMSVMIKDIIQAIATLIMAYL